MPEVTLRDGMVLVGSLLILAVMIDAWRRMRSQQRERVRMKLAPEPADAPPVDDLAIFRELPNGGARIVSREDLLGSDGLGPSSDNPRRNEDESEESGKGEASGGESEDAVVTPKSTAQRTVPAAQNKEPVGGRKPANADEAGSASAASGRGDNAEVSLDGMRADNDEPSNLDWLNDIPEEEETPSVAGADGAGGDIETEVIILHVMSRDTDGFSGKDILEILLACDLRFGDMNFFHRHEQQAGRGPIQFSVANMLQPGVFDIDNMDAMQTRGLVFFITLPGPEDMIQAFDYMLETARVVARNLGGELLDESRSVLTQQAVEHSRQQIRELERRLLAQRG
ncbi:cell division protein ZipA [Congregibacter litoralis]|uniref:cell division protein ZipA n=1 Tax=Congregibacter litoralis TaxID=393662 RepID=UPI000320DC3F|nr:cell division protein ZipA [Congregibacter litoralis]